MIRNIRNRFPAERWVRVVGLTTVGIAWITALLARTAALPSPEAPAVPDPPVAVAVATGAAGMPLLPGQGLVVLRSTPAPTPEPEVIVVPAPAGGTAPAATVSSGS